MGYKCPECPLWFTTKSNCDRHLVRKHGNNNISTTGSTVVKMQGAPHPRSTNSPLYQRHLNETIPIEGWSAYFAWGNFGQPRIWDVMSEPIQGRSRMNVTFATENSPLSIPCWGTRKSTIRVSPVVEKTTPTLRVVIPQSAQPKWVDPLQKVIMLPREDQVCIILGHIWSRKRNHPWWTRLTSCLPWFQPIMVPLLLMA